MQHEAASLIDLGRKDTKLALTMAHPVAVAPHAAAETAKTAARTRALLGGGILAGPLYVLVGGVEMFTRAGFDPTRHDLSLMSNGDLGWVHISLLIVTGLLVVGSSFGMRR